MGNRKAPTQDDKFFVCVCVPSPTPSRCTGFQFWKAVSAQAAAFPSLRLSYQLSVASLGRRCRSESRADLICIMDPIYVDRPEKHYPDRCVYILLSAQVTMVSDLSGPRLREEAGSRLQAGGPLKTSFRSTSTLISLCH